MFGGIGDDVIIAGGSDGLGDWIFGDSRMTMKPGPDGRLRVVGWANNADSSASYDDFILGGDGSDFAYGELGNDVIYGGAGGDILFGDRENDYASYITLTFVDYAGTEFVLDGLLHGNDALYGGDGEDEIWGDGGDDLIYGGADNDILYGGAGNDTLNGGDSHDRLEGGTGTDTYYYDNNTSGIDTFEDTSGRSVLYANIALESIIEYRRLTDGTVELVISENNQLAFTPGSYDLFDIYLGNGELLTESMLPTAIDALNDGGDIFIGALDISYTVQGGAGQDTIITAAGADSIKGGQGDDRITGGRGDDTLDGGDDLDT
jgi:Ca2+-binding RTX toxin-like protein